MPAFRRVLVAATAAAILATGATAAAAAAATLAVPVGCVLFNGSFSDPAIPILGSGYTPGGFVTISTSTKSKPTPQVLASVQANAQGNFGTLTPAAPFNSSKTRDQIFNLIATESANPAIVGVTQFRQVRAGYNREPEPTKPRQQVRHIVRGFTSGRTIYAHFRHGGKTRVTKSLGQATGPCGIASRKMRALPTKSRLGTWKVFVDQKKTYSRNTRPQASLSFTVFQRFT